MADVILYPPQLAAMAAEIKSTLGSAASLICTSDISQCESNEGCVLFWDAFPGASTEPDPNTKLLYPMLVDKDVLLLMSQDDTSSAFAQLSLLVYLQRFVVPNPSPEHASKKWKDTVPSGAFEVKSVRSLKVVIPWYRYCQMDRTCRWSRSTTDPKKPWDNSVADGPWLDVPTAHTYAALLSADPMPPPPGASSVPPPPPKQLLLIDLHDDLNGKPVIEPTLNGTGKWANPIVDYDLVTGKGTYFASALYHFLRSELFRKTLPKLQSAFVVFPDAGAYKRFHKLVEVALEGVPTDQVLFIEKSRVGTSVTQTESLLYFDGDTKKTREAPIPASSHVLIPDDFTNSGSTLFGGATIVTKKVDGKAASVSAFVSHFVAKYERKVVDSFVSKLYSEGDNVSDMNTFYCTDSVACSVKWLNEEVDKRVAAGKGKLAHVVSCAPVIAEWVKEATAVAVQ